VNAKSKDIKKTKGAEK
jgi:U3 small nucleolar RNA-associated protein 24